MNMKYRLDTNKFGRSINSLVTLEELWEMGAANSKTKRFRIWLR